MTKRGGAGMTSSGEAGRWGWICRRPAQGGQAPYGTTPYGLRLSPIRTGGGFAGGFPQYGQVGRGGFAALTPSPRRFVNRPYGACWSNGLPSHHQGEEVMRAQTPAVRTSSCCSGDLSRSSLDAMSLFKAFM